MNRHIAAAALVLAALGAASQVQAQGWDTGRSHGDSSRRYERSDHRAWQGDRRGGDSWGRSSREQGRGQWRDQGREQWRYPRRNADRDDWRGSRHDQWRDGYRDRYWSEPRGWYGEERYWYPRHRYYDYDYDGYAYDDDGDISLLISLPLQF